MRQSLRRGAPERLCAARPAVVRWRVGLVIRAEFAPRARESIARRSANARAPTITITEDDAALSFGTAEPVNTGRTDLLWS
jgi:hypothetical protein